MTKQAVLITGAAKRVGREIALHLAARGFDIALHYHTSQAEAEQTAAEIRVLGADCALFQADLAELEKLPGLMAAVHARFPQLAHLVNNASVFEQAGLLESDASLMARTFAVNFYAPVLLTQELARMTTGPASVTNLLDAKVDATQHRYFFYLLSKKNPARFHPHGRCRTGAARACTWNLSGKSAAQHRRKRQRRPHHRHTAGDCGGGGGGG